MTDFALVLLALALVLLNAFFVAAEFAMVKLRGTRIKVLKASFGIRGSILSHIHNHLDAYLSACQLGITFASLGLGWIGEPAFAQLIEPALISMGIISPDLTSIISFVFAFSLISFLHIVIGEQMPKSLAIRQSEKISLFTAIPLYGFYLIMYPAIWLLNTCSIYFLKILGLADSHQGEHFYSTDELKLLLNASHIHGELTREEVDILEHTLEFTDLKVTEAMRSPEELIMLDIRAPMEESMKNVIDYRYSRYPVYDSTKNDVIGIIHAKDIFATLYQNGEIKDLKPLIRPVLKISRRTPAIELLRKFREGTPHLALIYSGSQIVGFITLDNLLHILLGRIKDEFHRTQVDWTVNEDGSLTLRGDSSIYLLERAMNCDIDTEDPEIETLASLILHKTGNLPKEGERIQFAGFNVVIEKMEEARIVRVRVYSDKTELKH